MPPVFTSATNTAAHIRGDVSCAVIHRRKLPREDSKTVRSSHCQQASGRSLARLILAATTLLTTSPVLLLGAGAYFAGPTLLSRLCDHVRHVDGTAPPTERTQRTRRRVVQGDCADSQTRRLEPTSRPVGEHPQANTSPKGKRAEQAGRLSRLRLDESRSRQAWVTKSTQCVGCLKSALCGGILLTDDPHASGPTRLTSRP